MLFEQLRKYNALALAFVAIDGSPEGSEQRTCEYLLMIAHAELTRKQREAARADLMKSAGKQQPATPAPKAKAKAKPRARSEPPGAGAKTEDSGAVTIAAAAPGALQVCRMFQTNGTCTYGTDAS